MKENPEVIFVRVPPEIKAELKELADADRRPLNQYVRLLIEQHITLKRKSRPAAPGIGELFPDIVDQLPKRAKPITELDVESVIRNIDEPDQR